MACASCGKTVSGTPVNNQNFSNIQQANLGLDNNDFILMKYVGKTQVINSVVESLKYGKRTKDVVMYVHIKDVEIDAKRDEKLWEPID